MGSSRRKHNREFKIEAVKQVVVQGRLVSDVAEGLGIQPNMLSRWKTEFESDGAVAFPGNGKASVTDEEVRRLEPGKPRRDRLSRPTPEPQLVAIAEEEPAGPQGIHVEGLAPEATLASQLWPRSWTASLHAR